MKNQVTLLAALLLSACGGGGTSTPDAKTRDDAKAQDDAEIQDDGKVLNDANAPMSDAAPSPDLATPPADVGPDVGGPAPGAAVTASCGDRRWQTTLEPGIAGELHGGFTGQLTGLSADQPFGEGVVEMMKIVPPHPFRVQTIRVAFGAGEGPARLRITTAFGRSYPPTDWDPALQNEAVDLIEPVVVDVPANPDPDHWIEVDVSAAGLYLEPTQHYIVLYEHVNAGPYLALESVPADEVSRGLLFVPPADDAYGLSDGTSSFNYRLELGGQWLCSLTPDERWFPETTEMPFAGDNSIAVVDLNGDGHDDLVTTSSRVVDPSDGYGEPALAAYFGDGHGGFAAGPDGALAPFSAVRAPNAVVFGDVDNDGDPDLFSGTSVSTDGDLDGFEVEGDPPDCDDTDRTIHPMAPEVPGDGRDNNCDGVVDDGVPAEQDSDADGVTIGDGDCDDTRPETYPGAPERKDGHDNDCDGFVDEDFRNQLLLNDGHGSFVPVADAGVEALDPTTVAGFADSDADGKLDLYWGNWLKMYPENAAVPGRFVRGDGTGHFVEATARAGMTQRPAYSAYGLTWSDFDGDGWPDLFVGNYHMYPNQLWMNRGNGTFSNAGEVSGVAHDDVPPPADVAASGLIGGHTYGADTGDIDNDGDLDIYIPNLAHPRVSPWSDRSMFMVNEGGRYRSVRFQDETRARGFVYDEGDVMAAFGDYDNDGDLDLAIASLYQGHYSRLYRNDGAAGFVDVTYEAGVAVHDSVQVLWSDVDEDGWLDLFVNDRDPNAPSDHLFRNHFAERASRGDGAGRHWVELDLAGTTGNRDGLGARVTLVAGGVSRIREVRGGAGLGSTQHAHRVHFGLGEAATVDSMTVRWVGGRDEAFTGVGVDGRYRVVEGAGAAVAEGR